MGACCFLIYQCVYSPQKCVNVILQYGGSFTSAGEGQNLLICPPTCGFSELSYHQNHMHARGKGQGVSNNFRKWLTALKAQ